MEFIKEFIKEPDKGSGLMHENMAQDDVTCFTQTGRQADILKLKLQLRHISSKQYQP